MARKSKHHEDPRALFTLGTPDPEPDSSIRAISGTPGRHGQSFLWVGILVATLAGALLMWVLLGLAFAFARHPNVVNNNSDPLSPLSTPTALPSATALPSVTGPDNVVHTYDDPSDPTHLTASIVRALGASTRCRIESTVLDPLITFNAQASQNNTWVYPNAAEIIRTGIETVNEKCSGRFTGKILDKLTAQDSPEPLKSTVAALGRQWLSSAPGPGDTPDPVVANKLSFTTRDGNIGCTLPGDDSIRCTILSATNYPQPVTLALNSAGQVMTPSFGGTVQGDALAPGTEVRGKSVNCVVTASSIQCTSSKTRAGFFISQNKLNTYGVQAPAPKPIPTPAPTSKPTLPAPPTVPPPNTPKPAPTQ